MPVKTVTILVQAMTERANAQVKATSAEFDELRRQSPVEMAVKLDKAQAIAESRILAKEMSATVRDVVKLQADADGGGGIGGLLARLFRGASAGTKGLTGLAGGGLPGPLGDIPKIGGLPPAAAIGAVAAGLAALPFLAQAAAGGITLALGGGLAALGVAGALGTGKTVLPGQITAAQDALRAAQLRQIAAQDKLNQLTASGTTNAAKLASAQAAVASSSGTVATAQDRLNNLLNQAQSPGQLAARKALQTLSNDVQGSLQQIGKSFQPVLLSIFTTAGSVLRTLTPVLAAAVAAIAGPVKLIGDTLLRSLASPQAVTAIKTLGTAFGDLLKAFAPAIPGIVTSIADGFTNLFRAVSKNPKAIADMAVGLFHLIGILLDVLAWLTNVADYVEHHWKPVLTGVVGPILDHWHGLVDFFTRTVPAAFRTIVNAALRMAADITGIFGLLPGPLGEPFRRAHDAILGQLSGIRNFTAATVANITATWLRLNGLTSVMHLVITSQGPGGSGNPVGGGLAGGTTGASPGWHWVGERGPELAYMRGGEVVVPAHVARGYAGGTPFAARPSRAEGLLEGIAGLLDEQNDLLSQLVGVSAAAPAVTGAGLGAAMAMGSRSAVYGALYP